MMILVKVPMDRYHNMRLWCIANVATKNARRFWSTKNEKERTGVSAKHGTDYEIEFTFIRPEDEKAFKKEWLEEPIDNWYNQFKSNLSMKWKQLWN